MAKMPNQEPHATKVVFSRRDGTQIEVTVDGQDFSQEVLGGILLRFCAIILSSKEEKLSFVEADRLVLHWALGHRGDSAWKPCPYGWVTAPGEAWDGGQNAWQTAFAVDGSTREARMELHLPREAVDRFDQVMFTVKLAQDWLKHSDGHDAVFDLLDVRSRLPPASTGAEEQLRRPKEDSVGASDNLSQGHLGVDAPVETYTTPAAIQRLEWVDDDLICRHGGLATSSWTGRANHAVIDELVSNESKSGRSLMHRYNLAASVLNADTSDEGRIIAVFVWLRFTASRLLCWNRNYNVKPREISAAASKVWSTVCDHLVAAREKESVPVDALRLVLSVSSRGVSDGQSGQRIRDEILSIQRRNNCKGGMMEEWHQKLHNNSSPDDVVICEALIKFIDARCDITAYWNHLEGHGITRQRLESFDRPVRSEPRFSAPQSQSLRKDLVDYLRTLRRVHSSEDVLAAADSVLGYKDPAHKSHQGLGVTKTPIRELVDNDFRCLFKLVANDSVSLELALTAVVDARRRIHSNISEIPANRRADVIGLDIALESRARQLVESNVTELGKSPEPDELLNVLGLVLEDATLSTGSNVEFVMSLKQLRSVSTVRHKDWALRAYSAIERARNALSSCAMRYTKALIVTTTELETKLNVKYPGAIDEDVLRGTGLSSLSLVLTAASKALRLRSSLSTWECITMSRPPIFGNVQVVDKLSFAMTANSNSNTVLCCATVTGDEDVPDGVIAVVTKTSIDVLSHLAVRARNDNVALISCYDSEVYDRLVALNGGSLSLTVGADGDLVVT